MHYDQFDLLPHILIVESDQDRRDNSISGLAAYQDFLKVPDILYCSSVQGDTRVEERVFLIYRHYRGPGPV